MAKNYFCPNCKNFLEKLKEKEKSFLYCSGCNGKYNYVEEIAIFKKRYCEEYWENCQFGGFLVEPYLLEFIPKDKRYQNILDLGCGDGRSTAAFNNLGGTTYCLDSSFNNLIKLKKRNLKNVILINADAKNIPFPDDFFDLIISISIVEHIPYDQLSLVLKETHRVLRMDGLFLIRNDAWFYGILEKLRLLRGQKKLFRKPDPTHINMMSGYKFKKAIGESKFQIIQEDHFPFYRYQKKWKIRFPQKLSSLFATHSNFLCKPLR